MGEEAIREEIGSSKNVLVGLSSAIVGGTCVVALSFAVEALNGDGKRTATVGVRWLDGGAGGALAEPVVGHLG